MHKYKQKYILNNDRNYIYGSYNNNTSPCTDRNDRSRCLHLKKPEKLISLLPKPHGAPSSQLHSRFKNHSQLYLKRSRLIFKICPHYIIYSLHSLLSKLFPNYDILNIHMILETCPGCVIAVLMLCN